MKGDSKMTALYQEGESNHFCLSRSEGSGEELLYHFPISEYLLYLNVLREDLDSWWTA